MGGSVQRWYAVDRSRAEREQGQPAQPTTAGLYSGTGGEGINTGAIQLHSERAHDSQRERRQSIQRTAQHQEQRRERREQGQNRLPAQEHGQRQRSRRRNKDTNTRAWKPPLCIHVLILLPASTGHPHPRFWWWFNYSGLTKGRGHFISTFFSTLVKIFRAYIKPSCSIKVLRCCKAFVLPLATLSGSLCPLAVK